ncbi:uncharacterized protein LOC113226570 isoform X1 [Hyposmocoma kahamanoa]|uniref:uncharacterized protein LOC113226570 isoform X1 n=1 Tax=Hyposmocoma kahamanoa TaxID=1477025 RepID=UPI000E6D7A22|nr:uncharacterized protein LOC113226570 isoform X1 [Hyposmocoma kahamanoa]
MEAELNKKIATRGYLKGTITRLLAFISDLSQCNRDLLSSKRERLITVFDNYEKICQDILYLNPKDSEDVEQVESNYFIILTALDEAIKTRSLNTSPLDPPTTKMSKNLPPISIQPFDDSITARAYQLERDLEIEPKLQDFLKFLEKRALALENVEQCHVQQQARPSSRVASYVGVAASTCRYCKSKDHKIFSCKSFQLQPVDKRVQFIQENKMCFICLGAHSGKCKFHFRCSECKGQHNTLLHRNTVPPAPPVSLTGHINNNNNNVLLPTARIKVIGKDGTEYHVKALMDSGSQVSFVTTKVVQLLGGKPKQNSMNIIGIANAKSTIKACIPIELHSLKTPFKTTVNFQIIEHITCNLPHYKFDCSNIKIPKGFDLADEQFNVPGEINMLLGADVFFQALIPNQVRSVSVTTPSETTKHPLHAKTADTSLAAPSLQFVNTVFGNIVAGNIPHHLARPTCNKVVLKCELSLNEIFAKFWSTEKVPEVYNEKTSEQELCEQIFQSTVKLNNNQFEVALPLKIPSSEINDALGESFHFALKRFINLEKRLHANPCLFKQYQEFIHEYLSLNHGHYVDIELYDLNKDAVYFLPHHAVFNENNKTTKLRTVFDGSMKTNKKISLNDLQLNGPVVQRDLFEIILLFRLGKHTFTLDIRRMYRNIRLDPTYTSLQNILWRDNPNEKIKCIRLDTVTYGLKSSSYLATRCLMELANRNEKDYPLASAVIKNNSYVDDILYSNDDLSVTMEAQKQLCKLLPLGSFHPHKWSSNHESILLNIPHDKQYFDTLDLQKDNFNMKTLGLQYDVKKDHFIIQSPQPFSVEKVTKRSILSYIGKMYDPMGFISPIIVIAKAIMQKLCITNKNWNDSPPTALEQEWNKFMNNLNNMKPILLSRNVGVSDFSRAELIGFADASSTTAYGCCLYLRLINSSGKVHMHLLCSKSRINPLQKKSMTVPRLELNAALLLSKLVTKVYNSLKLKIYIKAVHLFSDSKIVLAWLNTEIAKLQAYVGNRVNVIRQNTDKWNWLYVNTNENPADLISGGVQPGDLGDNNLWWRGPQFLQCSTYEFSAAACYEAPLATDLSEFQPCLAFSSNFACQSIDPLEHVFGRLYKLSDINKMIRLLAYILRFLNNINKNKEKFNSSFLRSSELNDALMTLIKYDQRKIYKNEIDSLSKGSHIKGKLEGLHPFLDELGLLRVGGRLHNADISYTQKHPIILPKGSLVTVLLIKREHKTLLHAGPRLVLANLNQRFWIVNGLLEVKKITHECITCFRQKAAVAKQLMGSLPASRVIATRRPFEKIGVDYAGPIDVKLSRVRRSLIGKGYVLVMVCFTTKAVHLELASDLTTETFLACLKRFISRRGLPTEIHCDNASTFKGARSQLAELYSLQSSQSHKQQVYEFASQKGIEFHFIPSYSPTFGGLWEAAVKSTKYHLKRVLHKNVLTYEQLSTVLTEIEAVLNSRPLLPLSSDPNDYCYLTPGHFIIGSALTMYPENDSSDVPQNRLKFWQLCTNIKQAFWKMWHKYYLNVLQNRPKWKQEHCNVRLGSLVILKEQNVPCMYWPMARIEKLFTGNDGKVRAVEVRTSNNKTHLRAIHKICVLPIECD